LYHLKPGPYIIATFTLTCQPAVLTSLFATNLVRCLNMQQPDHQAHRSKRVSNSAMIFNRPLWA